VKVGAAAATPTGCSTPRAATELAIMLLYMLRGRDISGDARTKAGHGRSGEVRAGRLRIASKGNAQAQRTTGNGNLRFRVGKISRANSATCDSSVGFTDPCVTPDSLCLAKGKENQPASSE
jgi:hypothetical protein